jgi:outer membrane protein assembly factor BamC
MRYLKLFFFAVLIANLASCSYFRGSQSVIQNRDTDYLKADSIPPLKIPPGLSSSTITAHYPVSDREYPGSKKPIDLTPPEL